MEKWQIVVGLEVHVQLLTRSKIFSGSATTFGAAPNTQASAIDIGLPGVLPTLNKQAVEHAIAFGLAVQAKINRRSIFARKNYFYPDLPKGYQITQFETPIVADGILSIVTPNGEKIIHITRAHLEEDAGKSLHEDFGGMTGIDLNRAGMPLLEVVSEPDMGSAEEAVAYAKVLHNLVTSLGICSGNMQEGAFRMDANVSVRRIDSDMLGTRCEIKNLNSFKFLEKAINYEAQRQIKLIEEGGRIIQQTRLYDAQYNETRAMRTKEYAHDYRYFPDPDLPPLFLEEAVIDRIKAAMPELPEAKKIRFIAQYQLSLDEVTTLIADPEMAKFFEATVHCGANAKRTANWIMGEIANYLNSTEQTCAQLAIPPQRLAQLIQRLEDQTLSNKLAKEIFEVMLNCSDSVDQIIESRGLRQISDTSALELMVDTLVAQNPDLVNQIKSGKEKAFNALIGQVMKASRGKANPAQVSTILRQKLS